MKRAVLVAITVCCVSIPPQSALSLTFEEVQKKAEKEGKTLIDVGEYFREKKKMGRDAKARKDFKPPIEFKGLEIGASIEDAQKILRDRYNAKLNIVKQADGSFTLEKKDFVVIAADRDGKVVEYVFYTTIIDELFGSSEMTAKELAEKLHRRHANNLRVAIQDYSPGKYRMECSIISAQNAMVKLCYGVERTKMMHVAGKENEPVSSFRTSFTEKESSFNRDAVNNNPNTTAAHVGPGLDRTVVKNVLESAFTQIHNPRAIDILKQEIQTITRLARSTPDSDLNKPKILHRLSAAYKELYISIDVIARSIDEKIIEASKTRRNDVAKRLRAQQIALDKKAIAVIEASIKAKVQIRNKFPDDEAYDQNLFAIGYEIDQLAIKQTNKSTKSAYHSRAVEFYQHLIRNYPTSQYVPYAWMAYGEYFFHEEKDFKRAMKAYKQVVGWGEKNNPNYVFAIYYEAWCLIHMQKYKQATHQFNEVIQYSDSYPDSKDAKLAARHAQMELTSASSTVPSPSNTATLFVQRNSTASSDAPDAILGSDENESVENNLVPRQEQRGLTRFQVMRSMKAVESAVKSCGVNNNGIFKIKLKIESDGHVSRANAVGTFSGTAEGACAADAVRNAIFPRSNSSLIVTYPFKI